MMLINLWPFLPSSDALSARYGPNFLQRPFQIKQYDILLRKKRSIPENP